MAVFPRRLWEGIDTRPGSALCIRTTGLFGNAIRWSSSQGVSLHTSSIRANSLSSSPTRCREPRSAHTLTSAFMPAFALRSHNRPRRPQIRPRKARQLVGRSRGINLHVFCRSATPKNKTWESLCLHERFLCDFVTQKGDGCGGYRSDE